jgi:hypothetical protein
MQRPGRRLRPTTVSTRTPIVAVPALVVVGLLLAGCGQHGTPDEPVGTAPATACPPPPADAAVVAQADLDGDGTADSVGYLPATRHCAARLSATVQGEERSVPLDDALPVPADRSFAITVPGRTGDVAVLRQEHPRGGFQVVLLAWSAGAGLTTLGVDGGPLFPFVSTDVEPTPLAARCVPGGFEVLQAKRHEPIGIVPAWDVFRTRYRLNGTSTTADPPEEIADNVLEKQLRSAYPDLLRHALFENCRAAG